MASGIDGAARGDCMRGEFKGSGMGLLSLPFLAAAAYNGNVERMPRHGLESAMPG